MLDKLIEDKLKRIFLVGIFEANSQNESIYIQKEGVSHIIPCLRQQVQKKGSEACYYSLSDFIMPADTQKTDYIGVFTVTAGKEIENRIEYYKQQDDNYNALLLQSLSDRIAEAATELLHYRVRKEIWGYSPNETATVRKLAERTLSRNSSGNRLSISSRPIACFRHRQAARIRPNRCFINRKRCNEAELYGLRNYDSSSAICLFPYRTNRYGTTGRIL